MTISKRLFDMARAELNSLLDKASTWDSPHDPDADLYHRYGLDELTDEQLEAELERRHRARAAAKTAAPRPAAASSASRPRPARPASESPRKPSPEDEVRRAYAALEVPVGSNFDTVRKSYRTLMRKYHPDHHTGSPEKQKVATELAQKLTEAYATLERRLRK